MEQFLLVPICCRNRFIVSYLVKKTRSVPLYNCFVRRLLVVQMSGCTVHFQRR